MTNWEFAVDRGDFTSVDRGFSHEHLAFHAGQTGSRPHDFGYVRAQLGTAASGRSVVGRKAVCGPARVVAGCGHTM